MNRDQANKIISRHEPMVVACTYNILFTNDICCAQVIEALQALKRTPYYRHRVKQLAGMASKERHRYELLINGIIGNLSDFFADANDKFLEDVDRHVNNLYYSFKHELDKQNLVHSAELARLELARTLCDYTCVQHDTRMNELHNLDPRFKSFTLDYMRLTNLHRLLEEMMDCIHIGHTVNMNTPACELAFDVLTKKLGDVELIASAISVKV